MNLKNITFILLFALSSFCYAQDNDKVIRFDSQKAVSGRKFAIKDINPNLPANWGEEFTYMLLEYRITNAQYFGMGLNTDGGYNELLVSSFSPNGWNILAVPLDYFRYAPGVKFDMVNTNSVYHQTGWFDRRPNRTALLGVDSIGFRMSSPIGNPELEVRSITLSRDPVLYDTYLEKAPIVDEFGQWNLGEFEGKIKDIYELKRQWEEEENETVSTAPFNYSIYGGYKQGKGTPTGYFHTEKIDDRWWFVDPEGYLFLSLAVDCLSPLGGYANSAANRRNMYSPMMPGSVREYFGLSSDQGNNYHLWNIYRRYGLESKTKETDITIKRMDKWGLNTIGSWSDISEKKAFALLLSVPLDADLMGLADVYDDSFRTKLENAISGLLIKNRNNKWLLGYFVGNEPAWLWKEYDLCSLILNGKDRPIKTVLSDYLRGNDTWERRQQFVFDTFDRFLQTIDHAIKKYDPNHLNLGMRFNQEIPSGYEKILEIGKKTFDIFSFNYYGIYPGKSMLDRMTKLTGKPLIIGEFHFGTVDRGLAPSLVQVDSELERGVGYRYYVEQAFSHPALIGVAWFKWRDAPVTGGGDNNNDGLVDVTDRPYPLLTAAITETSKRLFDIHSGTLQPYSQVPARWQYFVYPDGWGSTLIQSNPNPVQVKEVTIPVSEKQKFPEYLYLYGDGSQGGWITPNTEIPSVSDGIFSSDVFLGEGELKFLFDEGREDRLTVYASEANQTISGKEKSLQVYRANEGADLRWKLSKSDEGKYKVTIDLHKKTIQFEKQLDREFPQSVWFTGDCFGKPAAWFTNGGWTEIPATSEAGVYSLTTTLLPIPSKVQGTINIDEWRKNENAIRPLYNNQEPSYTGQTGIRYGTTQYADLGWYFGREYLGVPIKITVNLKRMTIFFEQINK
jgi:hypothetical protein